MQKNCIYTDTSKSKCNTNSNTNTILLLLQSDLYYPRNSIVKTWLSSVFEAKIQYAQVPQITEGWLMTVGIIYII